MHPDYSCNITGCSQAPLGRAGKLRLRFMGVAVNPGLQNARPGSLCASTARSRATEVQATSALQEERGGHPRAPEPQPGTVH